MNFFRRVQRIIPGLKVAGVFVFASVISLHASGVGLRSAGGLFERLDRNGDDGLSLNEIPQQMKLHLIY